MNEAEMIASHLENGSLSANQAKLLTAYFNCDRSSVKTAEVLGVPPRSVRQSLTAMVRRRVVRQVAKQRVYEMMAPECKPKEPEFIISDFQRDWMLDNYKRYRRNRSEAARILGCSRTDICQMAIMLKIDS
ncbi:hypothetical protein [Paenibacillus sp. y28]|uniref:hypothetical protein n=1 Tax=Paenibacillus sp. y28 TaxID=3129110 RepID=UPI003018BD0A